MITGDHLRRVLHAIATGFPDRALAVIVESPDLEQDVRQSLHDAVANKSTAGEQARAIGDVLLVAKADQALINESYRCAFYSGEAWSEMASDHLYAQFAANRGSAILDKWVHYFPIYSRHLAQYRGREVKVLEIGVYKGGGLDMIARYLGPGCSVVGLDIDEAAVRAVGGRYPVVLGDQEDSEVLRKVNAEHGPFDVVIDDGGHTMRQQIVTVETLFPLLKEGGTLLVEDCHTSYWQEFGGALGNPDTFIEWSKARVEDLHSRHESSIDPRTVWATHLDGMHFYDSVIVFDKKRRFRSFNEVAGTSSYIFAERYNELIGNEIVATRDHILQERNALREENEKLRAAQAAALKSNGHWLDAARGLVRKVIVPRRPDGS